MKLQDSLDEAVAGISADLPALTRAARSRGLAIRRRRRALATVGGTVAGAVVIGAGTLLPSGTTAPPTTVAGAPPTATQAPPVGRVDALSGRTAPITGRGVVAALIAATDQVSSGSFSGLRGLDIDSTGESMGEFRYRPASGGRPGLVHLDLQDLSRHGEAPPYSCRQGYRDCRVRALADGDTLRTYVDEQSGSARGYRRHVAEVLSPARGLRLILGATNTTDSEKEVVRRRPGLGVDELATIASQPWWERTHLPEEYADAGTRLGGYRPLPGSGR